jgi:glucose-1-phosphate thymidylyltransferase
MKANDFIRVVEEGQNIKIAALEEISYLNGWIGKSDLAEIIKRYGKSQYGQHLTHVLKGLIKYTQK